MKHLILWTVLVMGFLTAQIGQAHDHTQHAKHNFVLFGNNEIFASHIVYKAPHNFQVVLKIKFDEQIHQDYLQAMKEQPDKQFIFLLDTMDVSQIKTATEIRGTILYEDIDSTRHTIISNVVITQGNFKIIFFDELPLSLSQ